MLPNTPALLPTFDGWLSWHRLRPWIEEHADLPGSGPVVHVDRLVGGTQNGVFRVERAGGAFVLRRPPLAVGESGDRTIDREASVLGALGPTEVPHSRLYAHCDDVDVLGCHFIAMEALAGFCPQGRLPGEYGTDASWRRQMGEAMVTAAAALAAVDPAALGLSALSRTEGWADRQVSRLQSQLLGYLELPGYRTLALPPHESVVDWLERNRPVDVRVGVLHGDLHWANSLFHPERPSLSGLIDWELASLGDPLLDLAWFENAWTEPGDPAGHEWWIEPGDGLATRAELQREYADRTARDLRELPWFEVLACFRLAVLLEGTFARTRAGSVSNQWADYLHRRAVWAMKRATALIRTN